MAAKAGFTDWMDPSALAYAMPVGAIMNPGMISKSECTP